MGVAMKLKSILLLNTIIILLFITLISVIPLSPGKETFERKPTFQWIGLPTTYTILIDDNPEFTTPTKAEVKGNSYTPEENLELGEHYWKVEGILGGKTQKFTITPKVSLKREEDSLKNDGNTRLKLDLTPGITGAMILDVNKTIKPGAAELVSARQDE